MVIKNGYFILGITLLLLSLEYFRALCSISGARHVLELLECSPKGE